VLAPKLASTGTGSLTVLTVASALLSVVSVTAGALVQKRLSAADIRAAGSVQNLGGAAVAIVVTALVSTYQWDNTPTLYVGLVWAMMDGTAARPFVFRRLAPDLVTIATDFSESHVPPNQLDAFMDVLETSLHSAGRVQEALVARELRATGGALGEAAIVTLRARRLPDTRDHAGALSRSTVLQRVAPSARSLALEIASAVAPMVSLGRFSNAGPGRS